MQGFWSDFLEWAAHPVSVDMPPPHWFYLIGMVLIFIVLWNIILLHFFAALGDLVEAD